MTNEQKAVKIAVWNGDKLTYPNLAFIHTSKGAIVPPINIAKLTKSYLTDLNYLVPVAVKVLHQLQEKVTLALAVLHLNTILYECRNIGIEGTYQPLFDAVHNAIVYLENQKKC